jgi:cytochrome c oxidase subunit 2
MFHGAALSSGKVDSAFFFIVATSVALLLLVTVMMLVFVRRYGHRRRPHPVVVRDSVALEIVWTAVPLVLVMLMFYFGYVDFEFIRTPPRGAMPVQVTARQWSWLFTYADGRQDDVLRVPLGRPVTLTMTSLDVIHSLYIPAFRIKEDCVPGMKTHLWFEADRTGTYEVFCTEYCGVGHSHMRSQVIVMPASDFDAWYAAAEKTEATGAAAGLRVAKAKGCLGCHSTDGSRKVGPTFKGLIGSHETVTQAGRSRTITVDAAFVRQYVLRPNVDVVKGYPPIMPKIPVTDADLDAVVAYLESLK